MLNITSLRGRGQELFILILFDLFDYFLPVSTSSGKTDSFIEYKRNERSLKEKREI